MLVQPPPTRSIFSVGGPAGGAANDGDGMAGATAGSSASASAAAASSDGGAGAGAGGGGAAGSGSGGGGAGGGSAGGGGAGGGASAAELAAHAQMMVAGELEVAVGEPSGAQAARRRWTEWSLTLSDEQAILARACARLRLRLRRPTRPRRRSAARPRQLSSGKDASAACAHNASTSAQFHCVRWKVSRPCGCRRSLVYATAFLPRLRMSQFEPEGVVTQLRSCPPSGSLRSGPPMRIARCLEIRS